MGKVHMVKYLKALIHFFTFTLQILFGKTWSQSEIDVLKVLFLLSVRLIFNGT